MRLPSARWLGLLLALLAAALVLALWPRQESPRQLIERKVLRMARAAQEKDLGYVMEQVSDRFRGPEGASKQELKQLLAGELFRGTWVRVFTTDLDVKLASADAAEVSAKFIFARSEAERLEDLAKESVVSSYEVQTRAEKEADGEWRFVSASYRQADPF
ncbi:MAG: hypothetical protein HYZ28_24155 [Myxococcales bacterium]|nr:hypothetical protein [Myxococcales bacterium]